MSTTGTAARLCASEANQIGAIRVTSRLPRTILLIDTSRRADPHECHSVDAPSVKISSTATQRLSQRGRLPRASFTRSETSVEKVLDSILIFLVFSKYEERRDDAIRRYVCGIGRRAQTSNSAAALVGSSGRDDCQRHPGQARYSKLDAFSSPRKAPDGRPGEREKGETVVVVFGKRPGAS